MLSLTGFYNMNRFILIFFSLLIISISAHAQSDSIWRITLRQAALNSFEGQSRQLKSYYETSDIAARSLAIHSRKSLDSLLTDSVFVAAGISLPLKTERLLDYRKSGNLLGANYELINIASELDSATEWNEFEMSLLEYATSVSGDLSNDKVSLLLSNCNLRLVNANNRQQQDSLRNVISSLETSNAEQLSATDTKVKLTEAALSKSQIFNLAMLVAFLILLVAFFVVRHGLRSKLRMEVNKNLDTSELQVLVRKNDDLKSECEQYKKTLEEVIQKMNSIDQTTRGYVGILEELKEMSLESLELFRQQLEESRSKLSPEVYMLLINAISRGASSLRDEYQRTIEQLS